MAESSDNPRRIADENGDADATDPPERSVPLAAPVDLELLAELRDARKQRLERIRQEIDAGTYDSDDLLDAAMERMMRHVDRDVPDDSAEK